MTPRQTSDERDDRQSISLGAINAKLEAIEQNRGETREIMRGMGETMIAIREAIARMVVIQEETSRRLAKIDETIGDDKTGLAGRVTRIEGLQMLDQSEIADLDKRAKNSEGRIAKDKEEFDQFVKDANKKIIGALVAACLALAGFVLRLMHILPS